MSRCHAALLVAIGRTFGAAVAEQVYLCLAEQPTDDQGRIVDWTQIEAKINRK